MLEEKVSLARETGAATAVRLAGGLDAEGFPRDVAWEAAPPIRFDHDWQGRNADAQRETEVRALWTPQSLHFRFVARYRSVTMFQDAEPSGRRDLLWDGDVVEVFLQPPELSGRHYLEFEVSPNGFWIDLEITPGARRNLKSGLKRRAGIDAGRSTWSAQLALPTKNLTPRFNPAKAWRVNFYRVEGENEPRFYSAWRPTGTAIADFHVPESFGKLLFEP